eukprot:TRINITY_DN2314_c0_g1_i1.p1 TRINITY_DN2314_c0_g1~~TRINITY_DN2314_c0_g1_i1.p1  ORF type:complete len:430 (+),score=66.43 TRINITY_DN2314_c0_g1_i1:79-1290(+)
MSAMNSWVSSPVTSYDSALNSSWGTVLESPVTHDTSSVSSLQEEEEASIPQLFLQPVCRQKYEAPPTEGKGVAPCPRFGHTAVVYNNDMIVFGGRDAKCLGDVWLFNFVSKKWAKAPVPSISPAPCSRAGHTAIVHNGKMYIFGGVSNQETDNWLNDMWALDLSTYTWEAIVYSNIFQIPEGRKGHTAVVLRDSMIVFGGGQDDRTLQNDLWEFNLKTSTWSEHVVTGFSPSARMYHVAVVIPGEKMIVFGGRAHTSTGFLNDVLEFSISSSSSLCTELHPTGPPPTHRMCSTAIYHNHTVAIFTGGSFSYLDDSHQLDLRKMQWSLIEDVTFGGRTRPTTVKWKNTVLTFGGCVHVDGYVNDFVEVELEPMSLLQTMREFILEKNLEDREGMPPALVDFIDS